MSRSLGPVEDHLCTAFRSDPRGHCSTNMSASCSNTYQHSLSYKIYPIRARAYWISSTLINWRKKMKNTFVAWNVGSDHSWPALDIDIDLWLDIPYNLFAWGRHRLKYNRLKTTLVQWFKQLSLVYNLWFGCPTAVRDARDDIKRFQYSKFFPESFRVYNSFIHLWTQIHSLATNLNSYWGRQCANLSRATAW